MPRFNNQNLFATGPALLHVGGRSLRHVIHQSPHRDGVALTAQGQSGRSITQRGDLMGDDPASVDAQRQSIEAALDGQAHDLDDDIGRRWTNVVMLSFEPGPVRRAGTRWAMSYRVTYLQLV